MSVTTDSLHRASDTTHHPAHERCVVCGSRNHRSLNLPFCRGDDGWVEATLTGDESLQGYPHMMHGGVISLLLDAAMTHCLFAHGCTGVTARMELKFRHPVMVNERVHIRAKLVRASPPAYQLKAELLQHEQVKTSATGLFVDRPELIAQETDACHNPSPE